MVDNMPPVADLSNLVLDRLRAGDVALGLTVRMNRSGEVARIARASGHHFVRVDLQHSLLDTETVATIAQTGLALGVPTLVRVRGVGDPLVPALLDAGVQGIVFPEVASAVEARACVEAVRFPPLGARSYGGGYPQLDYTAAAPMPEIMTALDRTTLVVCMVESDTGLAEVEAIAEVDGVDAVHLGLSDYLLSRGMAGEVWHDDAIAAIDRVVQAARGNGRYAGLGGSPTTGHQAMAVRSGVQLLTTKNDVDFLRQGATAWVAALHEHRSAPPNREVP
jgi:2-keto-3-deoxy-L-rhamnonate aldolase RhmA